jgi:hypothetical protein
MADVLRAEIRARRTPAAAARRRISAVVSPRRPRPTTTMRLDGSLPLVCRCVTLPALPWNFSACSTSASAPPLAASRRAAGSRSFLSSA